MANKSLFKSYVGRLLPRADSINEAGGLAYAFTPRHALAQFAATGCLNGTFYADESAQLATVLALASQVEPSFVAKTAAWARSQAHQKDLPALLLATLSVRDPAQFAKAFPRVVDSAKILRNLVQIIRSGVVGRKSLGSLPKRLVREWLASQGDEALFRASIGNDPSLADVVKMVHPRPATPARAALYAYLVGRDHDAQALPALVRAYEAFKRGDTRELPDVPHELLTALPLSAPDWKDIARKASWQALRMNLNTFARHDVFDDPKVTEFIAQRLRDPKLILRARVRPYQLLVAYTIAGDKVPAMVRNALQDALEISLRNVPSIPGKVWVCPDASGSMHSPITGYRKGSSTAVRCVDVAALITAAILRRNPDAGVIPFTEQVVKVDLNPRDTVLTNAQKMAAIPPGGTNCSAPLALLNADRAHADLVVFVSDNQSWVDSLAPRLANPGASLPPPTETLRQWAILKQRCPTARLVCIDLQPYGCSQAQEREDILNVGGFGDKVFDLLARFADNSLSPEHWIGEIEKTEL
ncbi:60 kDa SS-A/Ro ribonucleoprotein [Phycisphaerales bacterium]|nr:60 kDa SS-A/Ro ribonucleoprotein [Phycisphaerales bacterium]